VDGVLRGVVRQTREEIGAAARPVEEALVRSTSDLDTLAREADGMGRAVARSADQVDEARFARLVGRDQDALRTFGELSMAEKRFVTRLGEGAQLVTRRYPDRADDLIRRLGPEGLTAVRVYGDDVAEVIAREGPDSLNVLRKAGRPGWKVYTEIVLQNKKKLAAAGVLALFFANPEKFVDTAGNLTEYAVEQFARAGIDLAGAISGGAARGVEGAIGSWLARYGIDSSPARLIGVVVVGLVAIGSLLVLVGVPFRVMLRPFTWPFRLIGRARRAGV
jgi:hypothetical protein